MDPFTATVGGVIAGAIAFRLIARSIQQQVAARRLAEAVEPLGLDVDRGVLGPAIGGAVAARGVFDGIELAVRYQEPVRRLLGSERDPDPTATLQVELTLPVTLPPGFEVQRLGLGQRVAMMLGAEDHPIGDPGLDEALRVGCADPEAAREILDHPEVIDAMYRALRHRMDVRITGRTVRLREEARLAVHPGPAVEIGLQLAFAVVRAVEEPLDEALGRLGLARQGDRGATGEVSGVTVRIQLDRAGEDKDEDALPRTVVHAAIAPPLPAGIRLRPRKPGGPGRGVGTGNPVLDGVIEVQASDTATARALLAQEALTGPLLEVLHAWPGAYVHPRGVVIAHDGWLRGRLGDAVVAASELARALAEAAAGLSPEVTGSE